MNNKLSQKEYLKQCDDDILSIVILHSLEYAELLKLDGPGFPINFEVLHETGITESHISYGNYTEKIPKDIANDIGMYLKELLDFSSEKWTHSEFESNPFWMASRIKAKSFVKKLHLEGRGYWD